uniref:NADH-ubiquinone oxidoreductase chain 2 n=1 Tax=Stygobromus allegheniensis TaxID=1677011 RepID=A0A6C0X4X9_9CRUS|nr:NADH dehydrogenase subunit 2 [Stygobromus allegheniensis]QIC54431.1 NADH dehydrogenase subunit 2 [Stygobromus allegheniensis]
MLMAFHPSIYLFFISLCSSIFLASSTNSWFMAWLALEINLLSFIPLLLNNSKYSSESALKYFLTQTLASIIVLGSSLLGLVWLPVLSSVSLMLALLLKVGAAPTHQWLPAVAEGLPWPQVFVLLTIQKLAPLILITYLVSKNFIFTVVTVYMVFSAVFGSLGGLIHPSLRKILSFSSIAHMSWVLASIQYSDFLWTSYFFLYILILISVIYSFTLTNSNKLSHLINGPINFFQALLLVLPLLSLGGLPPFLGFVPKFLVLQQLMDHRSSFVFFVLLCSTLVSLFFYLRVSVMAILSHS